MPSIILHRLRARPSTGTTRLQRRARDLMSLASLAAFLGACGWLLVAIGLVTANRGAMPPASHMLAALEWLPEPHADYRVLALAWLCGMAATLAPLLALRRLGKSLWLQPALNPEMAGRFRTLAHALLFSLLSGWAAGLLASTQAGQYHVGFGMGVWSLLAAILLAYIVAELVREGAEAAVENRHFI